MMGLCPDLGLDLGTTTTRVYVRGKGILFREPSVVARDKRDGKLLAAGREAQMMFGRAPGETDSTYPIRDGVIANYRASVLLVRHFIGVSIRGRGFMRPRVMVAVPPGLTAIERKAVIDAVSEAGANGVELTDVPLAAAMGLDLDVAGEKGYMVANLGGGTTSVAIIALGDITAADCIRTGGKSCDEAIIKHVKNSYRVVISEGAAEALKTRLGYVHPSFDAKEASAEVSGRDIATGMPRTVKLISEEIHVAISPLINKIVDGIKWTLEKTSPELAADIGDRGLYLTGGGALLPGLDRLISEKLCLPVHVAEDPMDSVIAGIGKLLERMDVVRSRWSLDGLLRRSAHKVSL